MGAFRPAGWGHRPHSRPDAGRSCSRCCRPRCRGTQRCWRSGDAGAGELQLTDGGGDGGVELHLAVDGQLGSQLLGDLGGLGGEAHGGALAGSLGGERQHGDLGVDAEELGGLGALHGHFGQLLGGGDGDVALLVHGVLIGDVDGAVAHAELAQGVVAGPGQDKGGGDQMGALLGLDELQRGTDGVGGGVGRAASSASALPSSPAWCRSSCPWRGPWRSPRRSSCPCGARPSFRPWRPSRDRWRDRESPHPRC